MKGRLNALTERDVQASRDVITGTLKICKTLARVLVDPGSTYSYVSLKFTSHFNVTPEPLNFVTRVALPLGNTYEATIVYKACMVHVGEHEMTTNLIYLETLDFHALLRIDWLPSYHAVVAFMDFHTNNQGYP